MWRLLVAVLSSTFLALTPLGVTLWNASLDSPWRLFHDYVDDIEREQGIEVVDVRMGHQDNRGQWLFITFADGFVMPICCQPRSPGNPLSSINAVRGERCRSSFSLLSGEAEALQKLIESGEGTWQQFTFINGDVLSLFLPWGPASTAAA